MESCNTADGETLLSVSKGLLLIHSVQLALHVIIDEDVDIRVNLPYGSGRGLTSLHLPGHQQPIWGEQQV